MGTGRKLLLADDSVTIQKVVDLTFADEGMQVVTVSDGEQAMQKLEEFAPDIILLDVFMPKLNGYQVCERIKRDERFRHIPVMLLVGSFEPYDEAEARRVGAEDHLTKPFQSIKQLINRVGALVNRSDATAEQSDATAEAQDATPQQNDAMAQAIGSTSHAKFKDSAEDTRDLSLTTEAAHVAESERERSASEPMSVEALENSTANTAPLPPQRDTVQLGDASATGANENPLGAETLMAEPVRDFSFAPELVESGTATPAAPDIVSWAEISNEGSEQSSEFGWHDQIGEETLISAAPAINRSNTNAGQAVMSASFNSPSQFNSSSQQELAGDDALLDLDESTPAFASIEDDDAILDIQYPSHHIAPPSDNMDASTLDVYEAEIVAAAPEAAGFAEAQTSVGDLSADFASFQGQTGAREAAPSSATLISGQIRLEQLTPEAIDAIAHRAVELLSEKVVREIAWEVVPQLAELIIKRRLEEERSQTH